MPVEIFPSRPQRQQQIMLGIFTVWGASGLISHFAIAPKSTLSVVLSSIQLLLCLPALVFSLLRQSLSLTDTDLVLHTGPFKSKRIPISGIVRVRTVDAWGDSMSSNKKQALKLTHGVSEQTVVSPVDRDAFIAALRARNSGIAVD